MNATTFILFQIAIFLVIFISSLTTADIQSIPEFTVSSPLFEFDEDGGTRTHTVFIRFLIKSPWSELDLESLYYESHWFSEVPPYQTIPIPILLEMNSIELPRTENYLSLTCKWEEFSSQPSAAFCLGPMHYPVRSRAPDYILMQYQTQFQTTREDRKGAVGKKMGTFVHQFMHTDPVLRIKFPIHFVGAPQRTPPIMLAVSKSAGITQAILLNRNDDAMGIVAPEQNPLVPGYSTPNILRWIAQVEWNTHLGGMNKIWGIHEDDVGPIYTTDIGEVRPRFLHLKTEGDLFLMHNSTTPLQGSFSCWVNGFAAPATITGRTITFDASTDDSNTILESRETILQIELDSLLWNQLLGLQNLYRFGTFSIHCGPNVLLTAPTIRGPSNTLKTLHPSLVIGFGDHGLPSQMDYIIRLPITLKSDYQLPTDNFLSPLPMELLSHSLFTPRSTPQSVAPEGPTRPFVVIPPTVISPLALYHKIDEVRLRMTAIITVVMDLEYFSTESPCISQPHSVDPYWCPMYLKIFLPPNEQLTLGAINIGDLVDVFYESIDGTQKYTTTTRWMTETSTAALDLPIELINQFNHHNYFKLSVALRVQSVQILKTLKTWVLNEIYFSFSPTQTLAQTPPPLTFVHQIPIERWFLDAKHSIGYDQAYVPDSNGNTALDIAQYERIGLDLITKSTTSPSFVLLNTNLSAEDQALVHMEIREVTIHLSGAYEFSIGSFQHNLNHETQRPESADDTTSGNQALGVDPKVVTLKCDDQPCQATEVLLSPRAISFKLKFSSKLSQLTESPSSDPDYNSPIGQNGYTTSVPQAKTKVFTSMGISFDKRIKFIKSDYLPIENTRPRPVGLDTEHSPEGNISDGLTGRNTNTVAVVAHVVLHDTKPTLEIPTVVNLGLFFEYDEKIKMVPSALMATPGPEGTPIWFWILISLLTAVALFLVCVAFFICRGIIREDAEAGAASTISARVEKQVTLLRGHMNTFVEAIEKTIDQYQPPNYAELGVNEEGQELPEYDPELESSSTAFVIREATKDDGVDPFLNDVDDHNHAITSSIEKKILRNQVLQPIAVHKSDGIQNAPHNNGKDDDPLSYEALFSSIDETQSHLFESTPATQPALSTFSAPSLVTTTTTTTTTTHKESE